MDLQSEKSYLSEKQDEARFLWSAGFILVASFFLAFSRNHHHSTQDMAHSRRLVCQVF